MKYIIPIKKIITGEIQEFEFIRNNPIASTLGAAALGGAVVHDYHANNYNSVGNYIGDKIDTVKKAVGTGIDATKKAINNATSDHLDTSHLTGNDA